MAGWMEYLISVTFVIGWISSEKKNVVILSTKVDLLIFSIIQGSHKKRKHKRHR